MEHFANAFNKCFAAQRRSAFCSCAVLRVIMGIAAAISVFAFFLIFLSVGMVVAIVISELGMKNENRISCTDLILT